MVPKTTIQHVRAGFALFTVIETGSFVPWKMNTFFVWACSLKHISKNILSCFLRLFKIIKPLTWPNFKKNVFFVPQRECRAIYTLSTLEDIDSCFCREIEKKIFLCTQGVSEHIVFGQCTYPITLKMLLSDRESGANALHIIIALNYFTLVCNVISVLVQVGSLVMDKVNNFCKNKLRIILLPCRSNFSVEKTQ